jgi:hypothetical protein
MVERAPWIDPTDDAYFFVQVKLTPKERDRIEGMLATGLWGRDHADCVERIVAAHMIATD